MKVLQVISSFPPAYSYGGPLGVTYWVSKELVRRGHDVTVFTTDVYDAKSRFAFQQNPVFMDGIEVYHFRNLSNRLAHKNLSIAPTMATALRKEIASFDLVHLHEYRSFQAALVHHYVTKKNVPYILQPHGSLPRVIEKQNMKRIFDEICGFKLLSDAALIIALTEMESNQSKLMGVREHRIKIIPNAINLGDYRSLPEPGVFRNKFGLKNTDRIILFLGRIHKVKGLDLLLEAFLAVSKELENAKLVIAGPDEDGSSPALQKKAKDTGLSDRVIFPGPMYARAKLEAYIDADVYVLPSRYETFPNTVLEAAACGTPVILTDRCGIAETFRKYGVVVGYDVDQLRDALLSVLTDDTKRYRLAQEGRELVQREFRSDKVIEEIEKTYSEVAEQAISVIT